MNIPTILFSLSLLIMSICSAGVAFFMRYGQNLPSHQELISAEPAEGARIYDTKDDLYYTFNHERRFQIPIHEIPPHLIKAFLVAEDKDFYYHVGLDLVSIVRAALQNTARGSWSEKPIGASTITQQVAKNFLVGNEKSYSRKFREIIMAIRLEKSITKDQILEIYLNQIYLGRRSFGVGAASYARKLCLGLSGYSLLLIILGNSIDEINPRYHLRNPMISL